MEDKVKENEQNQQQEQDEIKIDVEPSWTQVETCKFILPDHQLLPGAAAYFSSSEEAEKYSPLAAKLFDALDETVGVLIARNGLTITMRSFPDWYEYSNIIAPIIRNQVRSGEPAVSPDYMESLPSSEELKQRVQALLDEEVNPAVAQHGGVVNLLDVKGNTVYLQFGGGCQGCGMSNVTLKYGVESLLREHVPQIGEILDTTDHASGQNPYYAPGQQF